MTTRALLRVNLRGAFFRTKKYIPAVNFCKTVKLILEENIMDKNYKTNQKYERSTGAA